MSRTQEKSREARRGTKECDLTNFTGERRGPSEAGPASCFAPRARRRLLKQNPFMTKEKPMTKEKRDD